MTSHLPYYLSRARFLNLPLFDHHSSLFSFYSIDSIPLLYSHKCTSRHIASPLHAALLSLHSFRIRTSSLLESFDWSNHKILAKPLAPRWAYKDRKRVEMADMRAVATEDAFSRNNLFSLFICPHSTIFL